MNELNNLALSLSLMMAPGLEEPKTTLTEQITEQPAVSEETKKITSLKQFQERLEEVKQENESGQRSTDLMNLVLQTDDSVLKEWISQPGNYILTETPLKIFVLAELIKILDVGHEVKKDVYVDSFFFDEVKKKFNRQVQKIVLLIENSNNEELLRVRDGKENLLHLATKYLSSEIVRVLAEKAPELIQGRATYQFTPFLLGFSFFLTGLPSADNKEKLHVIRDTILTLVADKSFSLSLSDFETYVDLVAQRSNAGYPENEQALFDVVHDISKKITQQHFDVLLDGGFAYLLHVKLLAFQKTVGGEKSLTDLITLVLDTIKSKKDYKNITFKVTKDAEKLTENGLEAGKSYTLDEIIAKVGPL